MASKTPSSAESPSRSRSVELPRPTVAPLVVAVGAGLIGLGFATMLSIAVIGAVMTVVGVGMWVSELLPGRGHHHEPVPEGAAAPPPQARSADSVEQLREGTPGYRMRMPEDRHPISAGLRGGIAGGLVMPIPALIYGIVAGHGIWYPINLLAGILLPGVGSMTDEQLERFHFGLLLVAVVLHVVMSAVIGLLYGVLMPTLPRIPKAMAWGGVLMPVLWTVVAYGSMAFVNPLLYREVNWPWFIFSQFVFGVIVSLAYLFFHDRWGSLISGLAGGVVGGILMPVPAVLWSLSQGLGVWFSINLLAGMVIKNLDDYSREQLMEYHQRWFLTAVLIHGAMTLGLGTVYGLLLPRLRPIPGPLVWGGLLLPLLWTASSYALMGVVNPPLQERVDWPWFVASQFVFGIVAAIVVVRSEKILVPPAGSGPDVLTRSRGT